MNIVTVKPKFRVTIPAKLRKSINLKEGDIMEAVRVDDGILFKQVLPPQKALTEIVETVDVREVELDDDKSSNCFRPFPNRGGVVTNELIDELRNQVGD